MCRTATSSDTSILALADWRKDQKGLKAFKGAKPGNKTAFNLFLAPKTTNAFKVNVWLDGPWDNATWKGKKIGEINVPANAAQEVAKFTIDVASSVENLKEKHAIFLVAEASGSERLCDIVGLGFSSDKVKIARPVPPTVSYQGQRTSDQSACQSGQIHKPQRHYRL
jgi:arabinoxylan arabinofuranohydrolase